MTCITFIISVIAGCTSFCSLSLGVGKAECILSQNGAGRLARRPARRIATLNHSHLSALSGGLLLLCGGDWEPLLGLPSSTGCASRWYQCCPVRHLLCWSHHLSPQPSDGSAPAGVMAEPARLSTLSALHSASGLPSLCAGSSRPLQSAAHCPHAVLRSAFLLRPLCLLCGWC